MRVNTKLYIVYAILLLSLIAIGVVVLWSIQGWQSAAGTLSSSHAQGLRAEKLRGDILRQIKEVLDSFVVMDPNAELEIQELGKGVEALFADLTQHAQTAQEVALIQALHRTHQEVIEVAGKVFQDLKAGRWGRARGRMEEELEGVLFPKEEGEIEALQAFYQEQSKGVIDQTLAVNRFMGILTGTVLILFLVQGVALLIGIQRWLVKPLDEIGRSTAIISTGNLTHRIPVRAQDELGELAASINRMASALQEIQSRLVQSERLAAIGELSSYIAHNIRNPLASVRAAAQVGLEDLGDSESIRETLQDIIYAVDKLEGWVRNLLAYIRPIALTRAPQNVNRLIHDVIALLKPKLEEKKIHPFLDLSEGIPDLVLDEEHMEQVFSAVITNAVEASPHGGYLRISSRLIEDGRVDVAISDNGAGIPPEVLQKVFDPYFTTKPNGVGLGLTMARKIVEAHGGAIRMMSDKGEGTTITICLPVGKDGDGEDPHHR